MIGEQIFDAVVDQASKNNWEVASIETENDWQRKASKSTIRFADGSIFDVTRPLAASMPG